jgi:hypothetical protein
VLPGKYDPDASKTVQKERIDGSNMGMAAYYARPLGGH